MKTPLSYYGGKQTLAPFIVSLMPYHRIYLEPCCGGSAVLFAKPRVARETINDLDFKVMNFWKVLRDRPEDLAYVVANTPYSREEWRLSKECTSDDELENARNLLVEVDQSFSRTRRSFSTPYIGDGGRWQPKTWDNLPNIILEARNRLEGVCLECSDAVKLIPRWDRKDCLIYCDPPYAGERKYPGQGYEHDNPEFFINMVKVLHEIKYAKIILSSYPAECIDNLGWNYIPIDNYKKRSGSSLGNNLDNAPEGIWTNYVL